VVGELAETRVKNLSLAPHPNIPVVLILTSPSGFLAELNDSFGGELWIDGILCYKEGLKVKDPFGDEPEWATEEEIIEIAEIF
jgi:hypothetical protein